MKLIELKNAKKKYLNKYFNLKIREKDKILITGINGSGKSTLIKLITKYIKPDKGEVIYYKSIKINYLEEIISLTLNIKVIDYIRQIEKIKKASFNYHLFQILTFPLNKNIFELSKGNKQKLALYITLFNQSNIYILDEPLNGLDNKTQKLLINYLNNLNETIVIVTHYKNDYIDFINKEIEL